MFRTATFVASALLLLAGMPAVEATAQDDAGLGRDAPNAGTAAAPIAPGSYAAQLNYDEGDMEDWYQLGAQCVLITVTFRAVSGDLYGALYGPSGLIGSAYSSGDVVALTAAVTGKVTLAFGKQDGIGLAEYAFEYATSASPQNDAASGCDAPQGPAMLVGSRDQLSGTLRVALGDHVDQYDFFAPTCGVWDVEVGSTSGTFSVGVHSSSGTLLASSEVAEGAPMHRYILADGFILALGDAALSSDAAYLVRARVQALPPATCPLTVVS